MLRQLRVRAVCVAVAAALALGTAGASFERALHDAGHDLACLASAEAHDASAHRLESAATAAAGEAGHCLACHSARSFRHTTAVSHVTALLTSSGRHRVAWQLGTVAGRHGRHLPPRAPPVTTLHV